MLWAGDGTGDDGADTFRIKIWWEEDDTENVVYDNGMYQAIGGGSIASMRSKLLCTSGVSGFVRRIGRSACLAPL